MTGDRLLILGIGNSLRRDDGAGLLLAEALAAAWQRAGHAVQVLTAHQLAPEHALEVTAPGVTTVLFVDAAVDVDAPQLLPVAAQGETSPAGGHTLGPATVLLYAQALEPHAPPRPAWLLTIPAYDLAHGEGLSQATQAYLDALVAHAADLWRQLHGDGLVRACEILPR